jgi:predicted glycogen debranching enzyme
MKLPSINLNKENLSRFEEAIQKEWIITNGLGGYASSTVLGVNTRKYHGLLVVALHPPRDRRILLAKLDEDITIESNVYRLGTNEFQTGFFPEGYVFLKEFSASPFPTYVYALQDVEVQKTVFMPYGKNAVIALYNILNNNSLDIQLQVFPIINGRQFHSVTDKSKKPVEFVQKQDYQKVEMSSKHPQPVLMMKTTKGHYFPTGKWVERIYLREEAHRGESCFDDCYQPGYFQISVGAGQNETFAVTAVAGENEDNAKKLLAELPSKMYDVKTLYEREMKRHEDLLTKFYDSHGSIPAANWLHWLVLAADSFIVQGASSDQKTVIAGYHWFGAWGRDTFISLPGLMFVTGRFEDARRIFLSFKEYFKQGLIPNFLPDETEQAVYNTVDATLWYVNAILQYLKYTGDLRFVKDQIWGMLKSIVEYYVKGTLFNIHVDDDGLLFHGPQLTWVDAAVAGKPVNPRAGKAVEVQALWYNSLRTLELLANKFNEKGQGEEYAQMAERAKESFAEKFWSTEKNYLFDVVSEHDRDDSLRPDQIIAAALDFTMLDNARNEKIVDAIQYELLTPYGLRTLDRKDSRYVGVYDGGRAGRDKAYHNGTVWPWLLGPFTTAYLEAKGHTEFTSKYAMKNFLMPLFTKQISEAGLGNLSEIFDGDPPYLPRGCISQAWSVAEPFRAYVEDIMQIRPKYEMEILQGLG